MARPFVPLVLAGAALLFGAVPAGADAKAYSASLAQCTTALEQPARVVVFQGDMKRVSPGERLEIRFDLLQRTGEGGTFERVDSEGLGIWNLAEDDVGRYRYTKRIENLAAPAAYRAVVSFRWRDGDGGRVVRKRSQRTPVCRQPDLRANLAIVSIEGTRLGPQRAAYEVTVRNDGRSPATATQAGLLVDGTPQTPQELVALAPGTRTVLRFQGPPCTSSLEARLDPAAAVDEASESDNAQTVPCPL